MCIEMCIDSSIDMCIETCIDRSFGMCTDRYIGMCIESTAPLPPVGAIASVPSGKHATSCFVPCSCQHFF